MPGPTLEELLDAAISSRLQGVWTALPARVLTFDAATSKVSAQPFPSIYQDGEAVALPVLQGVPVTYPAGGGCSITFPLQAGDIVLIVFSTLPLSRYRTEAADGDPQETRRFDLSDAWALPLAAGPGPAATPGASVWTPPTGGELRLGSPAAAESVVRGDALSTWLTTALSVATAFGPSGPAVAGLVPGVELSATVKVD